MKWPLATQLPHGSLATSTKSWLWHQRLSHLNFDTINDLAKNDLITGIPKFKYHNEHLCPSCGNVRRNENGYHHNTMVSTIEKSK
ncbi:retrovirus-related pol polyprotein from transposon TNT 1-94 [Tanacetum coccineum]